MKKSNILEYVIAFLFTFAGGFCDAYTFIYRGGTFANMQTGNLIKFFIALVSTEFKIAFLLPIIVFIIGCLIAALLRKCKYQSHIALISLFVIYIVSGFCPQTEACNIVCVCLLSLVGAMQFEAFRRCLEYRYTSTMCTNNMRLLAVSVAEKKFDKTLLYIAIIVVFSIGVISGALLGKVMGVYSISPIAAVYLMVLILQLVTKEVPNNEETAD